MDNNLFVDTCSKCGAKAAIRIKAEDEDIFNKSEDSQILWTCAKCKERNEIPVTKGYPAYWENR